MIRDQELAQLAKAVADWLPPGWRYNNLDSPEWQDPEIFGPNRMCLRFRRAWQPKGMITIHGLDARASINCNPDRPPKAIAADIKRRLLDDYAKQFAESQQQKAEYAEQSRQLELIAQCFERLGLTSQRYQSSSHEIMLHCSGCIVRATHYGCRLELNLQPDEALRVVGFLNSMRQDHEARPDKAPPE